LVLNAPKPVGAGLTKIVLFPTLATLASHSASGDSTSDAEDRWLPRICLIHVGHFSGIPQEITREYQLNADRPVFIRD
jgi:hypothetical protein